MLLPFSLEHFAHELPIQGLSGCLSHCSWEF